MMNFKKVLAFILSSVLSMGSAAYFPYYAANARTVEDIEQEKAANSQMIADLEAKLTVLAQSEADEKKYQETLNQQLKVISDNIALLTGEIEQLTNDIASAKDSIAKLDDSIAQQQDAIDEKVETFKKRLCEMYVSGNENFATVLMGTSSFYDIISRVEMLNRIADYDQKLIDDILSEISSMEDMKNELSRQKSELEENIVRQQESVEEKNSEIEMLNEKLSGSKQQMETLVHESFLLSADKDELEAENQRLEKESQEVHERNAREAQRLYEEELRKLALQTTVVPAETTTLKFVYIETTAATAAPIQTTEKSTAAETAKPTATTYVTAASQTEAQTEPPTTTTLPQTTQPPATTAPPPPTTEAPAVTQAPAINSAGWTWPVPGHTSISSPFGYRAEFDEFHKGIDISDSGIYGVPVVAARSGIVDFARDGCTHDYPKVNGVATCTCNGYFGNYVQISHDASTYSRYGHMKQICVSEGQYVHAGDVIGYVGCTGWSTGNHLHFDVNVNGQWTDPMTFFN